MKTDIHRLGGNTRLKRRLMGTALIGGAMAGMAAAPAVAQTAAAGMQQAEMAASDAQRDGQPTTSLEDIVVTAQRRSQAISQVPISVQAIGALELTRTGPVDTQTLISRLSPSVNFRSGTSLNSSSVAIRGVTSVGIEGGIQPSTSVVVDGVPLYRQGEFIQDLNDVQSVEVLRGPQGTLFGKNATAGVISINTRRPEHDFGGNMQAGLTNDKEYFANGALNVPLNQAIHARVTGFYRDQNPLVKNLGPAEDPFGARTYGITGKLDIDITPDLELYVLGGFSHVRSTYNIPVVIAPPSAFNIAGGGNLQQLATGIAYGYGNTAINTNTDTAATGTSKYVQAELRWAVDDRVSLTSLTSYRVFDTNQKVDTDSTPAGFNPVTGLTPTPAGYPVASGYPFRSVSTVAGKLDSPENIHYASQELRLNYGGERADLVAGLFYQTFKDHARATNPTLFDGSLIGGAAAGRPAGTFFLSEARYYYTLDNDAASAFADLTYKLGDTLSVFAGLRYTHETLTEVYHRDQYNFPPASVLDLNPADAVDNAFRITVPGVVTDFTAPKTINNVSGRAGVQWRPAEGQNYYASFNRGYKGPAAFTGRAAANTATTPAITKPEIATAFEIGTKQRLLENRLSLGLSLYKQKIRNIQQSGNVPGTILQSLLNAGDLKSKGAEFELQWQVARGLRLNGGVAYTDATYNGAGAVVACPTNQVCAGNGSNIPAGNKSIAGSRAINAPKWAYNAAADYTLSLGEFGSLSFNASYSWRGETQFAVNQDTRTIEPSHGFLNASVTLAARRNWELQLFARNLTNEFYYGGRSSAYPVGDQFGLLQRDYKRYGGFSVKYNF